LLPPNVYSKSIPPKRKVCLTPEKELERQSNAMINITVDLDENGHKLVYQKAKDDEILDKAAEKKIVKLIQSKTSWWIRYKAIFPAPSLLQLVQHYLPSGLRLPHRIKFSGHPTV
jgi:hypothetical protein